MNDELTKTIKLDRTNFVPGDLISGELIWNEGRPDIERIEIRLIWYTQGKGDQDCEVIDTQVLEAVQPTGQARFQFTAPTRPFSFSGKLISLIWAIEAISYPGKYSESAQFELSGDGREIQLARSFEQAKTVFGFKKHK